MINGGVHTIPSGTVFSLKTYDWYKSRLRLLFFCERLFIGFSCPHFCITQLVIENDKNVQQQFFEKEFR